MNLQFQEPYDEKSLDGKPPPPFSWTSTDRANSSANTGHDSEHREASPASTQRESPWHDSLVYCAHAPRQDLNLARAPPILPHAVRKQADRRGEGLGPPVASLCLLICNLPLAKPGPELQAAEEASCSEFILRGGPRTRKCWLTRQTHKTGVSKGWPHAHRDTVSLGTDTKHLSASGADGGLMGAKNLHLSI